MILITGIENIMIYFIEKIYISWKFENIYIFILLTRFIRTLLYNKRQVYNIYLKTLVKNIMELRW